MNDYQPVDLTPWCNVGSEWVQEGLAFPSGTQNLRGLPFKISANEADQAIIVGFGPNGHTKPIEIGLNCKASWILVAHRLLESRILEGEPVGRRIATYHFRLQNGEEFAVPIRERFEISIVPPVWGQFPLLAMSDVHASLFPRDEGRWDQLGQRQTDFQEGWPCWYILWAWKNPYPQSIVDSLKVEPEDQPFCIAALTVSRLEEEPFGLQPRHPIKIDLKNEVQADKPFDLSLTVDRGVSTYPYPLPRDLSHEGQGHHGWGMAYQGKSSPAYAEIAAAPSATVEIHQGGEKIAQVRWGEILHENKFETDSVRIELVDRGRNWVHVTIVDEETGKPLPCRVNFQSPEGIPYQPHGHHDHLLSDMGTWHMDVGGDLRLGHRTYAYIDGTCQGWLPRGQVIVDVARGYEYEPLHQTVTIHPGQRELTLRIKRWTNLNADRWFSGDSHVHFLSTLGANLEAQAEDLNVVNLLQSQWGHLFTNTEEFIGRPVVSEDGHTIVYTSQENRQHVLGHLILMGLKKPVMPWCSGGGGEAELAGTMETTLSHWADACHEQGGTVVIPHFPAPNCEPAALIATGRVDAVEMILHRMYNHSEYYRYLNCGYRLPLVGGTDKMTSDVPVGLYRTYVHIPADEEFNYENWCKNLRLGKTFLSGGPILRFTVNGAQVGDTIQLSGNGGTVEAEAEAKSVLPIHTLQLVQSGKVVAESCEKQGARKLTLKARLKIDQHTWLAARVGGPDYTQPVPHHYDGWGRGIMAHSSPIYVAVGGGWQMFHPETAQYMLTLLHGGIEHIRTQTRQYAPDTITHHHGLEDHLGYLEKPFHEAIEAVERRMREAMR